jgi:hypothetical protein
VTAAFSRFRPQGRDERTSFPDLLILLIVNLVPGTGAALAIYRPGDCSLPTLIASGVAFGYAIVAILCAVLMLIGILTAPAVVVTIIVLSSALWVIGLRRTSIKVWLGWARSAWQATPWELAAGGVAVALVLVALAHMDSLLNLGFANPWRYWADAQEVAAAGRLPSVSLQWGIATVPTLSKLTFNAANAGFSLMIEQPLKVMGALMFVGLIGVLLAAFAFAWELGLRWTAPLMVLFVGASNDSGFFAHGLVFQPGRLFVAETFSRLVAFTAIALGIATVRTKRSIGLLLVAGGGLGIAATIHLIPATLAGFFLCSYALVVTFLDRSKAALVRTGIIVLTAGALIVVVGLAARDRLGFQAASTNAFHRLDRFDPTLFFATGKINQPLRLQPSVRKVENGGWYGRPSRIYESFIANSLGVPSAPTYVKLFPVLALCLAVALMRLAPERLRSIAVASWLVWMLIILIALVFSRIYSTYIPAEFPERRLFPAAGLPVMLIGLATLECSITVLSRGLHRAHIAATAIMLLIAAVALLPDYGTPSTRYQQDRQGLAAMRWIKGNTPCDARILASNRTGGLFQVLTGRTAITEGMAPFLRPPLLSHAVKILIRARHFFAHPRVHHKILVTQGIDYVITAAPHILDETPLLISKINQRALRHAPFLEAVHESKDFDVYKVVGPSGSNLPNGTQFAGYNCGVSLSAAA